MTDDIVLEAFSVENFRGFRGRTELDLTRVRDYGFHNDLVRDGIIRGCLLIGRNGSGKTDLALALFDIVGTLTDLQTAPEQRDPVGFLNGDSRSDTAVFVYTFRMGPSRIEYGYRKTSPDIISYESLKVDGATLSVSYGPNSVLRDASRFGDPVSSAIVRFAERMLYVPSVPDGRHIGLDDPEGTVQERIAREGLTDAFRLFLREVADTDLDLTGASADGPSDLAIRTDRGPIPFGSCASAGVRMLATHFYWLHRSDRISFLFLDDFDAHYHFRTAESILRLLIDVGVRFILSSHSTPLVTNRILRPDCILVSDGRGISPLPELTDREIREGHSLERLLRGGEFDEPRENSMSEMRADVPEDIFPEEGTIRDRSTDLNPEMGRTTGWRDDLREWVDMFMAPRAPSKEFIRRASQARIKLPEDPPSSQDEGTRQDRCRLHRAPPSFRCTAEEPWSDAGAQHPASSTPSNAGKSPRGARIRRSDGAV